MKQGFTLIEFLLAFMFLSIILLTLFNGFFFINRVLGITTRVIEQDSSAMIVYNQFYKDISTATLPIIQLKEDNKLPAKQKNEEGSVKSLEKPGQKKPEEVKIKLIKRLFVVTLKGDMLSELTFVSSNQVRVYEQAKNVIPRPQFVRITYRLIENPQKKGIFSLYRKEEILDKKEEKSPTRDSKQLGYSLADSIRSMSISCEYPVFEKNEKKKELVFKEFKSEKSWKSDEISEQKKEQVLIPYSVVVKCILVSDNGTEAEYTFRYNIMSYAVVVNHLKSVLGLDDEKPAPKEPEKKEENKKIASVTRPQMRINRARVYQLPTVDEIRESMREFFKACKQ